MNFCNRNDTLEFIVDYKLSSSGTKVNAETNSYLFDDKIERVLIKLPEIGFQFLDVEYFRNLSKE